MGKARAALGIAVSGVLPWFLLGVTGAGAADSSAPTRFGLDTPGGRGGRIVRVTSLAGRGPGSLAEAVAVSGPRIVVFEVGGAIDLERQNIVIREPFVTVAGQTAPPPGITLLRGGLVVETHDVILQHLRVRPGDAGAAAHSGWEPDGLSTESAFNVLVDHCSFTWGVDENASVSGPRDAAPPATSHDVTFRHCLIAEGLRDASHGKGAHSMGTLVMDGCTSIALIGNLFASNGARNPLFKGGSSGAVVNNLICNPGKMMIGLTNMGHARQLAEPVVSVVGNVAVPGPDTVPGAALVSGTGRLYLRDNAVLSAGVFRPLTAGAITLLDDPPPAWPPALTAQASASVRDQVLARAGAWPGARDPVDARIVQGCRDRTGRIINSQSEVGGYPTPPATRRPLRVPARDVGAWLDRLAEQVEGRAATATDSKH